MSIYNWPTGRAFVPGTARLGMAHMQASTESALSGYVQTLTRPGSKWAWSFDFPANTAADRPAFEGFVAKLSGREHRVRIYDFQRPRPRGTCLLNGVVISNNAAAFATTIYLAQCGANTTLLAGDWLGLAGGQLIMVTDDTTANPSGVMTVNFRHALRAPLLAGTAVTLVQPTALYIMTESRQDMPRQGGGGQPGFSLAFHEVFA